jgi:hypothetical protein
MAGRIRIEPPNKLPSSGITSIQYKQWKVALKIFMHQTAEFREFYPGGLYPKWTSLEDDPNRIKDLLTKDTPGENIDKKEHLAQRRINLETFLGIIARYSDEGDFDDIMEKSDSLEWIFQHHERRYGLQRKGRYLFRLDSIRFDKATMDDYNKFYNDYRSCFKSNLRKQGEIIKYKGNSTLTEDERISPTTECLIIQITLERIDSRLPAEIDRVFGYRMDDSTTLIDLQSEIFSYIPRALATLDREENISCNVHCIKNEYVHDISPAPTHNYTEDSHHDLNAMYGRNQRMPQHRGQYKQPFGRQQQQQYKPQQKYSQKFCKVCHALELPINVVQSHNTNDCRKKTMLQEINMDNNYEQDPNVFQQYQQHEYGHHD